MYTVSKFGQRLKWLRMKTGKSQLSTARAIGIADNSIVKYEKGEACPRAETICDMADYFGVSVGFLLGEEAETKNCFRDRVEKIANHYGYINQRVKAMEELGELIVALAKGYHENIAEEMADSYIMLEQIKYLLGIDEEVSCVIESKIGRQLERMEHEND